MEASEPIYKLPPNSETVTDQSVNNSIDASFRTQMGRSVMADGLYRSQNFLTGSSGWQIDALGNAEFNDGTFRGTFILGGTLITINDITKLQSSINTVSTAGGGTVALEPGTYNATSSFTIPSNVTLDGNGATINFGGGAYQVSITGSNAYATGTLSVNFGSGSVTGSGTTWTAGMVGQSILIGDYWYTISARSSNTAITISPVFRGITVSGVTYVIATTVDGASIKNITLNNSSTTLLTFRYCNSFIMDTLTTTNGTKGISGQDSANVNLLGCAVQTCTTGITYNNVPFCTIDNNLVLDISGGTGISLTGVTNTSILSLSIQNVTGVGFQFTTCSNLGLINYSFIECTSHGVEFVSGNSDIDIDSGYINTCGGDGIKLTATSNRIEITTNNILNNTGYGVNIANANDNNNIISDNAFSSNTAGNLNDSGTSTIAKANQGVSDIPASAATTYKNGTTTKDLSDASTTQNIAHGLGKTPKYVRLTFTRIGPAANIGVSVYNGTTQSSAGNDNFNNVATSWASMGTTSIILHTATAGTSANNQTGVLTFDATNIIITWTQAGSPTGTYNIMWEAQG